MKGFLKNKVMLILTAVCAVSFLAAWQSVTEEQFFQAPVHFNATPFASVPISYSHNTSAITAHAGGGQGSATALTKEYSTVSVVASAADSVKLPTAYAGAHMVIENTDSTDALAVFPITGGTIDGGSANASVSLPAGNVLELWGTSATNWRSSLTMCVASGAGSFTTLAASGAATLSSTLAVSGIASFASYQASTFGPATAGTTQTQVGATVLSKTLNKVTTGNANDGVALPAGTGAMCLMISNISANALKVYGNNSDDDTIDGGSADASVTQAASTKSIWYCTTNGIAWTSFQ